MRKPSLWRWLSATAMITLLALPAHATTITADLTRLADPNRWEAAYTIANDTLAVDIEEFAIYFKFGRYEDLVAESQPTEWDPFVAQPDPGLLSDGFYDVLALGLGIAPGSDLRGFVVSFDFLGTGSPDAQFFEILDPNTFALLDSGFARSEQQQVPEPGTFVLFGSLVIALAAIRRRIATRAMER